MNDFEPAQAPDAEWQEARSRVQAYLQALGLAGPQQQETIIATVLERAANRKSESPDESATILAMREIRSCSEEWIGRVLAYQERAGVTGLVSLFAIDAGAKWPAAFLGDEVPPELERALRECEISAAPDLRVSRMVPQPFDSPLRDINLPNALGELTKNLSPSIVARAVTFVLSGLAFLWGNRLR